MACGRIRRWAPGCGLQGCVCGGWGMWVPAGTARLPEPVSLPCTKGLGPIPESCLPVLCVGAKTPWQVSPPSGGLPRSTKQVTGSSPRARVLYVLLSAGEALPDCPWVPRLSSGSLPAPSDPHIQRVVSLFCALHSGPSLSPGGLHH